MDKTWFYNRYGEPEIILLKKQKRFIDQEGHSVGFIKSLMIYNYKGFHCGWIENGVIRDLEGHCVGFAKGANDSPSPIFPIPQIPPLPPIPQIPPIRPIPQIPKIRPIKKFSWSDLSPITLFENGS